jgi:hypothetical protein
VAAVAVVALHQRAVAPTMSPPVATNPPAVTKPAEPISYTVPTPSPAAPTGLPPARLANYVLAHSRYSSGLDQRGVLADLLIEAEQAPAVSQAAHVVP